MARKELLGDVWGRRRGHKLPRFVLCCAPRFRCGGAALRRLVWCHRATHPWRPPAALPACGPCQGKGTWWRAAADRDATVGRCVPPLFHSRLSAIPPVRLRGRPPRAGTGHQRPASGLRTPSPPSSSSVLNDAPAPTSAAGTRRRDAGRWRGAAAGRAPRSVRPTGGRAEGWKPGWKGRFHLPPSAALPARPAAVPLFHAAASTAAAAAAASRRRTPRNHPPRSASST